MKKTTIILALVALTLVSAGVTTSIKSEPTPEVIVKSQDKNDQPAGYTESNPNAWK